MMTSHLADQSHQTGSTMLEVLISIVIFSFGLLGMLGLIVNSLKMTTTSNYRSIAAQQLTAIADSMKASPSQASVYVTAASATVTTDCLKVSAGCTADQLSATEYGLWQQRLATVLPSGYGTITSAANGRPIATICWDESRVSISGSNTCFSAQL